MTANHVPENPLHGKFFNVKYAVKSNNENRWFRRWAIFSIEFDSRYFLTPFDQARAAVEESLIGRDETLYILDVRMTSTPVTNIHRLPVSLQEK